MEATVLFAEIIQQDTNVYMGDGCDAQDVCSPSCGGGWEQG